MEHLDAIAAAGRQRIFRARYKLNTPGLFSHITQQAAGKEPLFLERDDHLTFLALFKEIVQKFEVDVLAFCLMPNHVHLLLRPKEQNLEKAMHALFSRYAVRFNHKYQRRGHLFGGRYRQAICLDPSYLLAASVYIHLNPVRAGLSEKPRDYRWSSCSLYALKDPTTSFVDPSPILNELSKKPATAAKRYGRLLHKGMDAGTDNALEKEGAVERFCCKLTELCPDIVNKFAGSFSLRDKKQPEVADLDRMISTLQVHKYARDPQSRRARKHLVEQLVARGFKQQEIADRLNVSRKTIYNILRSAKNYPFCAVRKMGKN